ncbi:acyl-CoA dehydrogenase family protein [Noviherbaspirillum sp. Root189]|uniref:acyl-CoA dehydrogenase family protein n=1 Tax=Noviherbaspirillum sp. Root189 TaxID=1736487 RepID=UPI000709C586|nr:acyl-CoA dehydrogenase family protein [Noviherbaspirillum sp. Root189]KRB82175.1 acyl-CoA dehydrogenase [Noviherbaspirillum sp. Root189]
MTTDLKALLATLRATAVERDRTGGHAAAEKELIRAHGLLGLSIPRHYGGDGLPWPVIYNCVREIATVDSALAHVLAFHHLQIVTVLIYGSDAQKERWLVDTMARRCWWGNAMNPLDLRLTAEDRGDGLVLNGQKGFCSGTRGSSYMTLSAVHVSSRRTVLGVVPTGHHGISILDDWDPIGQRQTDSNSVSFANVPLSGGNLLRRHDEEQTFYQSLRTCFAQLVLVNLYLGIAMGAFEEARRYLLEQGRPWIHAGVARATDDPYMIHRFAEMHVQISAATVLADRAAAMIEEAFLLGRDLGGQQRAAVAIAIAQAKVVCHRAGLHAAQELLEVAGARGAKAELGFDRFWRNVRTHTLHDPLDYKLSVLGKWALTGESPPVSLYN